MNTRSYARGAAILGQKPLFRDYLAETLGRPVVDASDAARELRAICDVSSRRELDSNTMAAARYLKLLDDFNAWFHARNRQAGGAVRA